jgi:hypothetical protein
MGGIARRGAAFDSLDQVRNVVWVEPDGPSEADGAQLAALDEALHGSGVDVEKSGRLIRGQEPCLVPGSRGGSAARSCCSAPPACSTFGRFVAGSRSLSFSTLRSLDRLVLRRVAGLEEGELTCVQLHSDGVTYQ